SYWQNPALNNLVSLDWGYDSKTVRRFFAETGEPRPTKFDLEDDSMGAAKRRQEVLLGAERAQRIRWRCEQIRDIYRDIVDRVRSTRPDMKVYVSISEFPFGHKPSVQDLREAGIDPALLNSTDGLVLIDGRYEHGAREATMEWRRQDQTEFLRPGVLDALAPAVGRPSTLFGMQYIEIPGAAWPSSQLGWPRPAREPWISSVT